MSTTKGRHVLDYPTLKESVDRVYRQQWAGTKNEEQVMGFMDDLYTLLPGDTALASTADAQRIADTYFAELARRGYSGATWNRRLSFLRAVFAFGVKRGEYGMPVLDRKRESPGRTRTLTREEEVVLLARLGESAGRFAVFLLNTGLRLGEALALRWSDVESEERNGDGTTYVAVAIRDSKSGKSRYVPLNAAACASLVYAFNSEHGSFVWGLSARTFQKLFAKAAEPLNLNASEDLVPHSLRHTFGTRLFAKGKSAVAVMRLMGHSSLLVTQRYAHANASDLRDTVDGLD